MPKQKQIREQEILTIEIRVLSLAEPVWRQLAGETLRPSDLTEVDRDYVASLLCIRDMDDDPKVFQKLELPFSTPSAKGHEVPLSSR